MPVHHIYADIKELFDGVEQLVLTADAAAGASTITVRNITGAAINQILCFREPGNEAAEIIATHASTAPSGTTVTLVTTLVRAHPAGTTVYIIPFNQVRFFHATTEADANADDSGLTALAAAQNINPTTIRNFYDDTVYTSGAYYYRFQNSVTSVNNTYSDPIPWAQFEVTFDEDQVGYILEFVRRKLGHEWDERFSKQTALDEINACLRYIRGRMKKWARYLTPNYSMGVTTRGVLETSLPADIYDNKSNKSVLSIRIGTADNPLKMIDEKEFDQLLANVATTTVRTLAVVGATTLAITNSYDFDDSGSVNVSTSGTKNSITYTGVTRSATAGVLTGIPASGDGSITAAHVAGTNVWQNESEGQPLYGNVRTGKLRAYPLPDSTWDNRNIFIDYYYGVTAVDSEADVIDVARYDMVREWLLWAGVTYWRGNGVPDLKNANFLLFQDILKAAIRTEVSSQKFKMRPNLNQIDYRSRTRGSFDST